MQARVSFERLETPAGAEKRTFEIDGGRSGYLITTGAAKATIPQAVKVAMLRAHEVPQGRTTRVFRTRWTAQNAGFYTTGHGESENRDTPASGDGPAISDRNGCVGARALPRHQPGPQLSGQNGSLRAMLQHARATPSFSSATARHAAVRRVDAAGGAAQPVDPSRALREAAHRPRDSIGHFLKVAGTQRRIVRASQKTPRASSERFPRCRELP